MTLLQLQYFQTLARVLHYTRTAEELHISQPSLSYAINELEKELGGSLFEKKDRHIQLTSYGQAFLPYVEKSLSLLNEGVGVFSQMVGNAPQVVRLGYFHSLSASLIPAMVERFYQNEENRAIRFQFIESPSYDIFTALQTGELDLSFALHQSDWAESITILRQPLYLAVASDHPLAQARSVTFEDFAREPQIVLERASSLRAQVDRIFAQRGYIPNVVFEVRECNAALQYVGLKFGVSVLPQVPAMDTEKVAVIPISDQDREFVRTVRLCWARSRPMSPAARRVLDFIMENFRLSDPTQER